MNPDIKARWLSLIESGEYNMGRNYLYNPNTDAHCPLGILVEMAIDAGVYEPKVSFGGSFNKKLVGVLDGSLNDTICNWAGISGSHARTIASRNDNRSLKYAVDFIKENL